jgi:sodium-coupled neutral amino acid transporter 9
MITLYPLLMYILRVQVCYSITKKEPTFCQVIFLSAFIIAICVVFAIWLPKIGTIIRFTGAFCGLVYLFLLPISLYLKWQKNIGQLTPLSAFIHVSLLSLGLVNFVAQFVVHVE